MLKAELLSLHFKLVNLWQSYAKRQYVRTCYASFDNGIKCIDTFFSQISPKAFVSRNKASLLTPAQRKI